MGNTALFVTLEIIEAKEKTILEVYFKGVSCKSRMSRGLDVIAISESRIYDTRNLASIFEDHEIYASLNRPRMGGGVAVLIRKALNLEVRVIFLDPEDKMAILGVSNSKVTVYTPRGMRQ